MPTTVVEAMPIMSGTYLAGSMISISAVTIPVLLETASQPSQLLQQWARTYDYGISFAPPFALTTLMLHGYSAFRAYKTGARWTSYAAAGILTISIVPFTILFMVPTNNELFRLRDLSTSGAAIVTIDQARELVRKWSGLHIARSMLPLLGALTGAMAIHGGH